MPHWTNRELERLEALYPKGTTAQMMEAIPRHTWFAINKMARTQGWKRHRENRDWVKIAQEYFAQRRKQ